MFHYAHIFNFNPWTLRTCAGLAGLTEAPETAQRTSGTTGAFFKRDVSAAQSITTENPQNAQHVHAMIRAHYAGAFSQGRTGKPFVKLAKRFEETLTGLALGPPAAIGESVARSLRSETDKTPTQDRGLSGRGLVALVRVGRQPSRWVRSCRSWRSCASTLRVAMGRASRRRMLIGSAVSSQ